ncbi:hypothetical protein PGT21_006806 [Puccinia graminis f. sp. tritici]|uniref:Uncharacterized protein n=2 Tax=Puccinia graminis f. sp. tritici TaxID=56615 RepID=E3JVX3_PUCGT|nr:uncharacterized protein PGTG_02639 [Puccinia graminis f. sp. tritici CRL 75-36-700-3]EFP76198.2 hypothetical protein PGTG_02639 [Puccinia graminis f. sp. tritici CRL 75-36-700-3]KAA1117417.1 hypothetical protein PGT21_006806 [Puccinia graminis f. sp. tritici]KAA1120476.1 hypothetical protein PGTUg99_002388 [Puccinia graminis f. sp. tritici]
MCVSTRLDRAGSSGECVWMVTSTVVRRVKTKKKAEKKQSQDQEASKQPTNRADFFWGVDTGNGWDVSSNQDGYC